MSLSDVVIRLTPHQAELVALCVLSAADNIESAADERSLRAAYRRIRDAQAPAPQPETEPERKPCEGFAWIGQSLQHCDDCGEPAWEHAGVKELKPGARLFTDTMPDGSSVWQVRPWTPGHRRVMAARYDVDYTETDPAPETRGEAAPDHRHDFGPDRDQPCPCGYPSPPF